MKPDLRFVAFVDLIDKAKRFIISRVEDGDERKWLSANVDSYETSTQRITLFVLEGSPPRGYVIANYSTLTVKAFSIQDKTLRTWNLGDELAKLSGGLSR